MNRHVLLLLLPALTVAGCDREMPETDTATITYPETKRVDNVDEYHGTEVADSYRWLEDDVRENPEVRDWVERQNEVTFSYLEKIGERARIRARLTELWNYERFGLPVKEGGRYFYSYNDGLQNQDVVYTLEALDAEPQLLIDPNTWSEDGTVALASYSPSPDGNHFAYLVQDGGSDWRTARVLDLATGEVREDKLEWLKFTGLTWAADGSGFYYSRYPATDSDDKYQSLNRNHAVYFHMLGEEQSKDRLVYTRPEHPDWGYAAQVTDDGHYLVITVWLGTDSRFQVVVQDLETEGAEPWMLIEGFDYDYTLAGSQGDTLYFRSNNGAPRGRLLAIDLHNPGPDAWEEIIPQTDDVLKQASLVGGQIIAEYMHDAYSVVRTFDTSGADMGEVELPGIGSASGFHGKADDSEAFFSYESFNTPDVINRLDVATGEITVFRKSVMDFESDDYVVEQVFYSSKDGTRVPMFISHRKDMVPDGDRPTMLYGYGGFDVSLTPSFSITRIAWMELGGIYAVANLRGGGEYGKEWHQAGTGLNKQNVFDDFIAAAEYLISENYTNPDRLAISGGSNGGLLVGAVTNQRPDLFAAALPAVGVMDMLRFHRFTAGRFWVDDYGSADDPEEFKALYAYSPYHNVRPGTEYPALLITTADTDDRVVPGHSFKYAAAMQAAQAGKAPVLIRIETRAGHGAGIPTDKLIEEYADRWAFLVHNLGVQLPEGYGLAVADRR
jgi:prolyl oligopeptidase